MIHDEQRAITLHCIAHFMQYMSPENGSGAAGHIVAKSPSFHAWQPVGYRKSGRSQAKSARGHQLAGPMLDLLGCFSFSQAFEGHC